MQRRFDPLSPASRVVTSDQSSGRWVFAGHAAMALVVLALLVLTIAAIEAFLAGDNSLNALQAADMIASRN
jgi:hypothetical protein